MESGGGFSAPARSAIPATASARIEIRLVNGLDPVKQNALVVEHIRKQGYFVIDGREPTDVERLAHSLIARIDPRGGSTAPRVSMDDPMARAVVAALTREGRNLRLQNLWEGIEMMAAIMTMAR
jgi:acetylornithine deacetylase/succinyl-diaminopimelate desuccinylase-like protein